MKIKDELQGVKELLEDLFNEYRYPEVRTERVYILTGDNSIGKSNLLRYLLRDPDISENSITIDYINQYPSISSKERIEEVVKVLREVKNKRVYIDNLGKLLDLDHSKTLITYISEIANSNNLNIFGISNNANIINLIPIESLLILDRDDNSLVLVNIRDYKNAYRNYNFLCLDNYNFYISRYWRTYSS